MERKMGFCFGGEERIVTEEEFAVRNGIAAEMLGVKP